MKKIPLTLLCPLNVFLINIFINLYIRNFKPSNRAEQSCQYSFIFKVMLHTTHFYFTWIQRGCVQNHYPDGDCYWLMMVMMWGAAIMSTHLAQSRRHEDSGPGARGWSSAAETRKLRGVQHQYKVSTSSLYQVVFLPTDINEFLKKTTPHGTKTILQKGNVQIPSLALGRQILKF